MSVLQDQPKLFNVKTRTLSLYLIEFGVFLLIPFVFFKMGAMYYFVAIIVLFAVNSAFKKQIDNLFSLIVYYFPKKRIRNM